jgi:hypothetical protein
MSRSSSISGLRRDYQRLSRQLSAIKWICHGSIMKRSYQRPAGKDIRTYGPYYSWTRKVNNKTVTVALSLAQYRAMHDALANHRRMEAILAQMRHLSEQAIFTTTCGVAKRNR